MILFQISRNLYYDRRMNSVRLSSATDLLTETLKTHGYSDTHARRIVFELLWEHEPQSMHELYQRCAGRLDRASLYRATTLYEQLGIVRRVHIGWKYKLELSELFNEHHHHLSCMVCGKVVPISQETFEHFIQSVATEHGFKPLQHQIEIQGTCRACTEPGLLMGATAGGAA